MNKLPRTLPAEPTWLLDASLSYVNRTGAHYLAEELCRGLAADENIYVRRWRFLGKTLPPVRARMLMGKAMMRELGVLSDSETLPWPEPNAPDLRRVFLDPLYVIRSQLAETDVVVCHDIGPITHPELYEEVAYRLYSTAYAKLARVGPGMVFVSETSKAAFQRAFTGKFRFMRVISPHVRDDSAAGVTKPVPGIDKPFLLTVGALERRKNQLTSLRAFAESRLHEAGYSYVLCGTRGSGAEEVLDLARRIPGVHVLGYVAEAQLRWLYKEASAFVLPSLLEGFGMPALEAAHHGLISIVSRDSALSEAVGDLGVPVDPHSTSETAAAMRTLVSLPAAERKAWGARLVAHAATATRLRFLTAWRELLSSESYIPVST